MEAVWELGPLSLCASDSLFCSLHSEAVVVDDREQFPGVTDSGHECGGVKDYSRVIDGLQSQLDRYKTSMLVWCVYMYV